MKNQEIINKYLTKNHRPKISTNLITFEVATENILELCVKFYQMDKLPLKTIKAVDTRSDDGCFKIFYIFAVPGENVFLAPFIRLEKTTKFPSLVNKIYEANCYEMEIQSFFGLTAVGHSNQQQFILHGNWPKDVFPLRKDFKWDKRPQTANVPYKFQTIAGEGIYQIPVGPIHAGIIEPGHFRFSVAGEEIVFLEPQLGFVHKGSEKLFETLELTDKLKLSERISGDTSFSHSLAFCQAVETLGNITVPARAEFLRVIYSELERLANHLNDTGYIINDTAFNTLGSIGTRLREQTMQICERLTKSRFLRGVNTIGGVTKDIDEQEANSLAAELKIIQKDYADFLDIAQGSEIVQNRLKTTGILTLQTALDHGVVGIAARAVGLEIDARIEYPYAAYEKIGFKMARQETGDVYARFMIRAEEIETGIDIILKALKIMPKGKIINKTQLTLAKDSATISITEGWRGDIVYFVTTDTKGEISRVGVRDASFLNWPAVPYAVIGNIVPDFPLINKSFNLSYSGFDR